MINQVIKLVAPRRMETFFKEENINKFIYFSLDWSKHICYTSSVPIT